MWGGGGGGSDRRHIVKFGLNYVDFLNEVVAKFIGKDSTVIEFSILDFILSSKQSLCCWKQFLLVCTVVFDEAFEEHFARLIHKTISVVLSSFVYTQIGF